MAATRSTNWFWSDWSGDQAVRRLTPAERGVWIDLLALASVGEPVGYVCDKLGRPLDLVEIGRFTNCSNTLVLAELIDGILEKGAASRDRTRRLYNRRMVRDAQLSAKRRRVGRDGGEATRLKWQAIKEQSQILPRQNAKQHGSGEELSSSHVIKTLKEVGEDARARSKIPEEAHILADQVAAALGWESDNPLNYGTPYEMQRWIENGWDAGLCLATVQRVAAGKTIRKLSYFEGAIAQAHAELAKPLPVATNQTTEVIHAPSQRGRTAWQASRDEGRDAHAELRASIAADEQREEGGRPIVEFLPASRRG